MYIKLLTVLLMITLTIQVSCNDDETTTGTTEGTAANECGTTSSQLKDTHINMACALFEDSLLAVQALELKVNAFLSAPSDQALEEARVAYKATRKPYQQSEMFRWDEGITTGKGLDADGGPGSVDDWEGQVNAWPLDETQIEAIMAGSDPITPQLLIDKNGALPDGTEDEANVTTGVHAIEFMLWYKDANARGAGQRAASEFAAITGCDGSTTPECRNSLYLKAATDLLVADLTTMRNEWTLLAKQTNGTLANNIAAASNKEVLGYMLEAVAQMADGELAGARLTAGLSDGTEDAIYEEEHDCFSDLSHFAVYYNLQGLFNVVEGTYTREDGSVVSGSSFATELAPYAATEVEAIRTQLQQAKASLDIVFNAGEKGSDRVSFDMILEQSNSFYKDGQGMGEKPAQLKALEDAAIALVAITPIAADIADVIQVTEFNADNIGETD